jgi:hypothetical protein
MNAAMKGADLKKKFEIRNSKFEKDHAGEGGMRLAIRPSGSEFRISVSPRRLRA